MSKDRGKPGHSRAPGRPDGGAHIGSVSGSATVEQIGRDQNNIARQINIQTDPKTAGGLLSQALRGAEPIWNIPSPIRSFAGRESDLAEIHSTLVSGATAALVPATALHGMGGVGKSQLALAYAESYSAKYRLGWWVPAETELEIITGLARLAERLGLHGEPRDLAAAVLKALGDEGSWLLIFDNATPQILTPFLPSRGGGAIIITSRSPAWQGIATGLPVDVLPVADAVDLLLNRSAQIDREAAEALAEELGCLPLALEQAASYMAGPPALPLPTYLAMFRSRKSELLNAGSPVAYGGTIDATFSLAVDRLEEMDPVAIRLLELFAFFAPDGIPVGLAAEKLHIQLNGVEVDPLALRESVVHLSEAGLLTEDTGDLMRMHRLVQDVVRAHLGDAEQRVMIEIDIGLMNILMPDPENPNTWATVSILFPHARAALAHARRADLTMIETIALATNLGLVVTWLGLGLEIAIDLDGYALEAARRLKPRDNGLIALTLNNLGKDLSLAGELRRARQMLEEALDLRRRIHAGDHGDVAETVDNLAYVLRELGETALARQLHEENLAMRRRLYEGEHALLAHSIGHLGTDLSMSGEHALALQLHREALDMMRRLHEGDHPDIATAMSNLGGDLTATGDAIEARELFEAALAMRRRLFDGNHEAIAQSLLNLAVALPEEEDQRAFELDQEAVAMFRRLFPGDHQDKARSLHNLSVDLRRAGEPERADQLDEEASEMRARLQGTPNPPLRPKP